MLISHLALQRPWSSILRKQLPENKFYIHECNLEKKSDLLRHEVKWSEVAQSYPTLCDPMDCSLPGFSVHGILQARILEWVTISFSRGSSQPRDRTQVSCIGGRRFNLWATREAEGGAYSHIQTRSPSGMPESTGENAATKSWDKNLLCH